MTASSTPEPFVAGTEVGLKARRRVFEASDRLLGMLAAGWSPPLQLTARKLSNGQFELRCREWKPEENDD